MRRFEWLLILLVASFTAHGQDVTSRLQDHFDSPSDVLSRADELRLTRQQRADIVRITEESQARAEALRDERDRNYTHLNELLSNGESSQEVIQSVANQVFELENRIKLLHLEMLMSIRQELTDEQVRMLKEKLPANSAAVTGKKSDVYELEPLIISRETKREMVLRTIQLALDTNRSDRLADLDKLVCEFLTRIGTHIPSLVCATNLSWEHWRTEPAKHIFVVNYDSLELDAFEPGKIIEVRGATKAEMERDLMAAAGRETPEENARALKNLKIAQAIGFRRSKQGHSIDTLVQFVNAYQRVKEIISHYEGIFANAEPGSEASLQKQLDNELETAIQDEGLTVELYNRIATDVEMDATLRSGIQRGLTSTQQNPF